MYCYLRYSNFKFIYKMDELDVIPYTSAIGDDGYRKRAPFLVQIRTSNLHLYSLPVVHVALNNNVGTSLARLGSYL